MDRLMLAGVDVEDVRVLCCWQRRTSGTPILPDVYVALAMPRFAAHTAICVREPRPSLVMMCFT
jgi:hypothetical protein